MIRLRNHGSEATGVSNANGGRGRFRQARGHCSLDMAARRGFTS